MIGIHRTDCGCSYCLRPTVRALDTGPDKRTPLERDLDSLMASVPDTWYGGREVTDGIKPYSGDCDHERTTNYLTGKWCRDCGRWL